MNILVKAFQTNDLDDACKLIQDALGIEHGDNAGRCFNATDVKNWPTMESGERLERMLGYVAMEMTDAAWTVFDENTEVKP